MRFIDRIRQWMSGRYGRDELNTFLSFLCIILLVINMFVGRRILFYLALAVLVILYLRTFSKNYSKRRAENEKFLQIKDRITGFFTGRRSGGRTENRYNDQYRAEKEDREHVYFSCPRCRKRLRVPRGRGKISIHCPQCGNDFIERT